MIIENCSEIIESSNTHKRRPLLKKVQRNENLTSSPYYERAPNYFFRNEKNLY